MTARSLEHLNEEIARLKAERARFLKQMKERKKLRQGVPDIIGGNAPSVLVPLGCTLIGEDVSTPLRSLSCDELYKGLAKALKCKPGMMTVVYTTSGTRAGVSVETLAFKHRYNKLFNTLMSQIKGAEVGSPRYVFRTKTWTLERNVNTLSIVQTMLGRFFKYIVEAQSGRVYGSSLYGVATFPVFTDEDGITHSQILNTLVQHIYAGLPADSETLARIFDPAYVEGPFLCKFFQRIPVLAQVVVGCRDTISTSTEDAKSQILAGYSMLAEKINDDIMNE